MALFTADGRRKTSAIALTDDTKLVILPKKLYTRHLRKYNPIAKLEDEKKIRSNYQSNRQNGLPID